MAKIENSGGHNYVVYPGFLWFAIPKVASSSIKWAFGVEPLPKASAWEEAFNDIYSIAFVRHPLDRVVSGFGEHFGRKTPGKIEQHIDTMLKMDAHDINTHVRPQWCFFKKDPSFLGRFETLQDDWSKLMGMFPFNSLGHIRKSKHLDWQELPPRLIDKAREVYKGDFDKFGY